MKKRIILIAAMYYVVAAISGCLCNCKDMRDKNFIYSALETNINSCSLSDTSFFYEPLHADSLAKNKLNIQLSLNGTIVFEKAATKSFSLLNTANACKCAETIFNTTDSVSSIKITTLNNFDSSHTAGADITAYFKVLEYAYSNKEREITQKPIDSFFHYSYAGHAPGFYLNIYLSQAPQYQSHAQFQIKITCKNGKEFETKTQRVFLY